MPGFRKLGFVIIAIIILAVIATLFGSGQDNGEYLNSSFIGVGRIRPLPQGADILFVSNMDSGPGSRRSEIYALDLDTGDQARITTTNEHHFIMGIDPSRRYIVTSRAEKDTSPPAGLGDEDRRALWLIDLETKEERRLTDIENHAESRSFSPDGEWIVFAMRTPDEKLHDIYKIKKDGTSLTRLTNNPQYIEVDAAWSNNGDRIAFDFIDKCDSHMFKIKNWALITTSAIIAFSISRDKDLIVLVNLVLILAFMYLELIYKSFQDTAIEHTTDLAERIDNHLHNADQVELLKEYEFGFGRRLQYPSFRRVGNVLRNKQVFRKAPSSLEIDCMEKLLFI